MTYYIGQVLGFLAPILMFVSYQTKSPKKLLMIQNAGVVSIIIHYLLIGASSGFLLNVACLIRNFVYYYNNVKLFKHPFCPYVLALLIGGLGALSWQGPVSLLIILALMANTVFMSLNNNQILRISVIFTCSMILTYNFFVHSYAGMLNEGISMVSAIIGIYRYRKQSV